MTRVEVTPVDRIVARLVYGTLKGGVAAKLSRLVLKLAGVDWRPREVGLGLRMPHSTTGSVVHYKTRIGRNVTVLHGVTIGRADSHRVAPQANEGVVVGDGVVLATGCVVLFRAGQQLTLAPGTVVGANAVLLESTSPGEVWAGNPARRVVQSSDLSTLPSR